ncbi:hypothetical protein FA95DRAFT_378509 [Auriscalpium vulgare]|uniref:Uncharacterized protein n=1 Tax=Auriscalpium vulgare TaxID=40419 RepID=A0ACB8S3N4_9AGAM|nr:hypothetical protein FA95DRAFT_378509 [Auriscalpium vulgare]
MDKAPDTSALLGFLESHLVKSILSVHPNSLCAICPRFPVPEEWASESWWDWASAPSSEVKWLLLLRAYMGEDTQDMRVIPPVLMSLISAARSQRLHRSPLLITRTGPANQGRESLPGMSPKKAHEVTRMGAYILHLTTSRPGLTNVKHVVDIGAGQGYLSRELSDAGFHVLALDGNPVQTKGAERRDRGRGRQPRPSKGSLTHKTLHIATDTLEEAVSSWLRTLEGDPATPIPVLFVALHACGTLTPDILRTFLTSRAGVPGPPGRCWLAKGAIIVGCCYNLMSPAVDFPLSAAFKHAPTLSASHLQLAAQTPSHWLDTAASLASAELSVRKVTYRALLEAVSEPVHQTDPNSVPSNRLGRLPDSVYISFPNFVAHASSRLGRSTSYSSPSPRDHPLAMIGEEYFSMLQQRAEVVHILRCLIGPSIESAILLDRVFWLKESLMTPDCADHAEWDVDLVGLFDQAVGSARNMALVVTPVHTSI